MPRNFGGRRSLSTSFDAGVAGETRALCPDYTTSNRNPHCHRGSRTRGSPPGSTRLCQTNTMPSSAHHFGLPTIYAAVGKSKVSAQRMNYGGPGRGGNDSCSATVPCTREELAKATCSAEEHPFSQATHRNQYARCSSEGEWKQNCNFRY